MLSKQILAAKTALEQWWKRHTARQNIAALVFVVTVIWFFISLVWGPTPLEFVVTSINVMWPRMTLPNVIAFVVLCVALLSGAVLWVGYYEQRVQAAEARAALFDARCEFNRDHLKLNLAEDELKSLKTKVQELQGKVDGHATHMAYMTSLWTKDRKARAALQFELLVKDLRAKGIAPPKITVRFIDFNDGPIADKMVAAVKSFAAEWDITPLHIDGSTIRRPESLISGPRILIESSNEIVGTLAFCFQYGEWAGEDVQWAQVDNNDVLMTIFPPMRSDGKT